MSMSIAYRLGMDYSDLKIRSRRGDSNSRPAVYESVVPEINFPMARSELTATLTAASFYPQPFPQLGDSQPGCWSSFPSRSVASCWSASETPP